MYSDTKKKNQVLAAAANQEQIRSREEVALKPICTTILEPRRRHPPPLYVASSLPPRLKLNTPTKRGVIVQGDHHDDHLYEFRLLLGCP